jgi:hypothetical protein
MLDSLVGLTYHPGTGEAGDQETRSTGLITDL